MVYGWSTVQSELILLGTSDHSAFSLFGLKPRKARCSSWAHETWVLLFSISTLRALGGKHRKFLGNRSSFCSDAAQLHHSCCSATAPPPSPHPEPRFPHYPRQQPATHHLLPYLSGARMLSLLHVSGWCFLQSCSCISLVYQTPSPHHMSCSTPVLEWPWEMVKDREAWCAAAHGLTKWWTWLSDWTASTHPSFLLVLTLSHPCGPVLIFLGYWVLLEKFMRAGGLVLLQF